MIYPSCEHVVKCLEMQPLRNILARTTCETGEGR